MRFVVSLALDLVSFIWTHIGQETNRRHLPFSAVWGSFFFTCSSILAKRDWCWSVPVGWSNYTFQWSHWGLLYADKTYLWLILILSIPANSMSSIRNLRRSIQQICFISHTCLLAFFKLTCVLCLGSPNAGVVCTVITKTSVGIRRYHGKKIGRVSLCSINWPYIPLSHQENQQILKRRDTSSLKDS